MSYLDRYRHALGSLPEGVYEAEVDAERRVSTLVKRSGGEIVETGSSDTTELFVRASGDKTGYAYTDVVDEERLVRAAEIAAYVASGGNAGTTVSLTNPGTIGTLQSVPRLMPGQGVIVGVGSIDYPPEWKAADPATLAELGVSKVITISSTYDHRIIQGAESGLFLKKIHELLTTGKLRQREELTGGARREIREAVLFVEKCDDAKHSLRIGYLVNNCGWSPAYTFRAAGDRKQVAVECNAIITQTTGEDWSDVKLTLSTASPALSASVNRCS